MKYNLLDTETTGTDTKLNHLFQISGRILDENLKTLRTYNFKFRPHSLEHWTEEALAKTGMTIESLKALPMSAIEAYQKFEELCGAYVNRYDKKDKFFLVAYNAKFDSEFIREFFTIHGNPYYGSFFWNPPICVMQKMAWLTAPIRASLPDFKLGTICKIAELGWDESKAHDADYDIEKTLELFKYLKNLYD